MRVGILHTAFIGDLALAGLLIDALHRGGHEVVLFTRAVSGKIYEHDARLKKLILVKKGKGLQKLSQSYVTAMQIRNEKVDVLLLPHKSFHSGLIAKLSGVPKRIGFSSASGSVFYTHSVEWNRNTHESLRCLALAKELVSQNAYADAQQLARPVLVPHFQDAEFRQRFSKLFDVSRPFFLVSPGSVWHTKKYPIEGLAEVIARILEKNKTLICAVNGGPTDLEDVKLLLDEIDVRYPSIKDRVIDASKDVTLVDLLELTKRASFSVCNDSGPLHIAAGVDCPSVGIFGPTPFDTGFGPSGKRTRVVSFSKDSGEVLVCQPCSPHGGTRCPAGHFRCMKSLSPDVIVKAVVELLPEMFSPQ